MVKCREPKLDDDLEPSWLVLPFHPLLPRFVGRAIGAVNDDLVLSNIKRTGWQDAKVEKTPGRIRIAWANQHPNMASRVAATNKEVGLANVAVKSTSTRLAASIPSLSLSSTARALHHREAIVPASRQEDGEGMVGSVVVAGGSQSRSHSNGPVAVNTLYGHLPRRQRFLI